MRTEQEEIEQPGAKEFRSTSEATRMGLYQKERRHFPRCHVTVESAVLVYPTMTVSRNLLDVSLGGASFSYRGEEGSFRMGQPVFINLISSGLSFEDLPSIVANDTEIEGNKGPRRRCGVKFMMLSNEQREMLAVLIKELGDNQFLPDAQ